MSAATHSSGTDGDFNLVEIWIRRDPVRWMAGAFAGLFAALVMWLTTALMARTCGNEGWFLLKAFAIPLLGGKAMAFGFHPQAIFTGAVLFGLLAAFLGVIFAHFTGTNRAKPLLAMGVVWGCFSWIFLNNLFSSSFREVFALQVPKGYALGAWMAFGIAMASVSFFDRLFRSGKSA